MVRLDMPGPVLLTVEALSKSYTSQPLFDNLSFTISEGDHVGLVGPNGSGKSTLLKILAGEEQADSGTRALRRGTRIGYVPQDPVFAPGKTIEQVLIADSASDDYEASSRVAQALGKAGFTDRAVLTDTLSGGWRKRLAIARELAREPDILLLDEPTNHLDVDAILWLESLLRSEPEAFVVVSHDRLFLENVAGRMLELNRIYAGGMFKHIGGKPAGRLAAVDPATGALDPTFTPPTLDGVVRALALSPDGSVLYVGGDFSQLTAADGTVDDRPHVAKTPD